jgi:hypothetical protein
VVLTHDVESPGGLANCRQLAELELKLGFRSSFNFIPEGPYAVPPELRNWLTDNGFEVGVHDLEHNGKLFQSHRDFQRKAARINDYLKQWDATGFRAGFMLRNLDWLHELEIGYDASTFDTDPFEPQSDGANTIFPFWIPAPVRASEGQTTREPARSRPGYIELPYTLPQDSTMFLVLREPSIDVWKRKCDWIANHRGMMMLITHPDYMAMNGSHPKPWEYPVSLYERFLRQIQTNHDGAFWHALPKEVARFSYRVLPEVAQSTK